MKRDLHTFRHLFRYHTGPDLLVPAPEIGNLFLKEFPALARSVDPEDGQEGKQQNGCSDRFHTHIILCIVYGRLKNQLTTCKHV